MPPLAVAAIGAAASIGGGLLSASATKKAANKASDTSLQTATMNNALTQGIYNQNSANLQPFMQSGTRANALLDNLLYGYQPGQPPQAGAPMSAPMGGTNAMMPGPQGWNNVDGGANFMGDPGMQVNGQAYMPQQGQPQGQPGAVTTNIPPVNGANAWDAFRNSTNYGWRLGEGLKALNQGYAARGTSQSGAAMKGINNYAQNFASNELGNWMNMLSGQQNLGLSGASALAGVGQNMVNNVTANNNSAGTAAANAQLIGGQQNAALYGNIANSLGQFAGSLGSSYQRKY